MAAQTPFAKLTFAYKTLRGGVEVVVDAYLPESTKETAFPALVYYHGGGLVMGSREWDDWFPVWLLEDSLKAGFIFLPADHALLCPENGFDLVQDVKDLFAWIQTSLNLEIEKTGKSLARVDPGRLAVAGQSGGATMAFYAGLYAQPKPKAVLVTYPMGGDLLSDPYVVAKTNPFFQFRSAAFPLLPSIEPYLPLLNATKASSPPTTSTATDASVYTTPRATLNMWLFQSGNFLDILTGVKGLGGKLAKLPWEERDKAVLRM
ncbi:hypothetical protein RQP46_002806 [Phenoliferia psychrophenolica]